MGTTMQPPASDSDPPPPSLGRVLLLTQLLPKVTADVIQRALSLFGEVTRVVMFKDPLCPSANQVTWQEAAALVEMGSESSAEAVLEDAKKMLLVIGAGPRCIQAFPATLAMLDPDDWPEFFPADAAAAQQKPRLRIIDVSTGANDAGHDMARQELLRRRSLESWKKARALMESHVRERKLLEEKLLEGHRQLHLKQQQQVDAELRKLSETNGVVGHPSGAVLEVERYLDYGPRQNHGGT